MKHYLCLLLALALHTIPCLAAEKQAQDLIVTFVSGSVTFTNQSATGPVQKGQLLKPGDILVTDADGYVDFGLETNHRFRLNPKSRATVVEASKMTPLPNSLETSTRLALDQGSLLAEVKKLSVFGKFEITTPVNLVAIRGTSFYLHADGTCRVMSGQVLSIFKTPNQTTTVFTGQTVESPAPGTSPVSKPTPKDIARKLESDFKDAAAHRIPKKR